MAVSSEDQHSEYDEQDSAYDRLPDCPATDFSFNQDEFMMLDATGRNDNNCDEEWFIPEDPYCNYGIFVMIDVTSSFHPDTGTEEVVRIPGICDNRFMLPPPQLLDPSRFVPLYEGLDPRSRLQVLHNHFWPCMSFIEPKYVEAVPGQFDDVD